MPQIEILDPEKHAKLRVRQDHRAYRSHLAPVVATELRELAVEYPVVLVKNPETGRFGLFALLGFREGENLYVDQDGKWHGYYLPLDLRRQPFGVLRGSEEGKGAIAIDTKHALVSDSEGRHIFEKSASGSTLVTEVEPVLTALMSGAAPSEALISALAENDLITPGQIAVPDGEGAFTLEGFYTVSSEKMAQLSPELLARLNGKGLLYAIHLIMASMANVAKLLARREQFHCRK